MAVRIPRDYQRALRDFALDRPRVNWWAGPGTGKTGSGLELFDHLRLFGEADRLLVASTKRIAAMVWPNEIAKWENFHHLSIAVAVGTPEQRIAAIKRGALITTINYENLPWLADTLGDEWPWDMVIADESTRLKSLRIDMRRHPKSGKLFLRKSGGSERAIRLAKVSHKKVRRWINMTGTPAPNGLIDNWGQMWFIDGGQRLGRTFSAFKERYFRSVRTGDNAYDIRLEPYAHSDAEIKRLMADVTMTIDARDYMDLPDVLVNKIAVRLPPDARKLYTEMEREMFIELQGHEVEAFNSGARSMKCRQLASGAVYLEPDPGNDTAPWLTVHDAKLDALQDIVSELNGAAVLIAYQFRSDLARLRKAFPKGRFFDDNPQTLADFRAGKFQVLFIHPASGGHGIDGMQDVSQDIVFFSMTWNLEEYEQVIARIGAERQVSAGFFRDVRVHLLIAEDTVEEEMVERIETKATVQESLKLAMKRRG
jgi:SNF2 family DNA or RNA helicase